MYLSAPPQNARASAHRHPRPHANAPARAAPRFTGHFRPPFPAAGHDTAHAAPRGDIGDFRHAHPSHPVSPSRSPDDAHRSHGGRPAPATDPPVQRPDGAHPAGRALSAGLAAPVRARGFHLRNPARGGHKPRAGAYGVQGHGKPAQGRGGPRRGTRGRLPERRHQLRLHRVPYRHARRAVEAGHGRAEGHGLSPHAGPRRA